MSNLIRMIQAADDFVALGAVELSAVKNAENSLGVAFASDYSEYALSFGAASFNSRELTGICSSDRLSVVAVTEKARRYFPSFPSDAYVVEELTFDHVLIIQDLSGNIYSYGPEDKATQIAKSLQEYLFA